MTVSALGTSFAAPRAGELSRSWLLVNARYPDVFSDAAASGADEVVLDVEDAVDPRYKDSARDGVVTWLAAGGSAWVRVNARSTDFWDDDMRALRASDGLRGVVLAKAEHASEVVETVDALGGRVPVVPLVESALGIERALEIAQARGVLRLAFGSGDYRRDTGAANTDAALAYPRSRLVVASRASGLPGPIDGPTVADDETMLSQETELAADLGMTGRLCLRPEQAATVNRRLAPSREEIAWASAFLGEFEQSGGVIRDGSDLPRLSRARRIRVLARTFRVGTGG